jgi:hypothetical protein
VEQISLRYKVAATFVDANESIPDELFTDRYLLFSDKFLDPKPNLSTNRFL